MCHDGDHSRRWDLRWHHFKVSMPPPCGPNSGPSGGLITVVITTIVTSVAGSTQPPSLPLEPDVFRAKFWPVAAAVVVANHPNSVAVPPSTDPYHRPALWHCRSPEPVRATLAASEPPFGLDSGHGLGNRCCQCDHRLATDIFRPPLCSVVPLHRSSSSGLRRRLGWSGPTV